MGVTNGILGVKIIAHIILCKPYIHTPIEALINPLHGDIPYIRTLKPKQKNYPEPYLKGTRRVPEETVGCR